MRGGGSVFYVGRRDPLALVLADVSMAFAEVSAGLQPDHLTWWL
jgi:hypothetical protein